MNESAIIAAQGIKRRRLILTALVLILAFLGFLLPRYQPFFFSFEHTYADVRTMILSPVRADQHSEIVLIKITEGEIREMKHRSPIDRKWLADLIANFDAREPAVIAVNVLIDQPTDPSKDDELVIVLQNLNAKAVVVSADSRFKMTPAQKNYNSQFISKAGVLSGFVNTPADENDIIRELPHAIEAQYPDSFADVVVKAKTGALPPKPRPREQISWLRDIDHKTPAIKAIPAIFARDFPDSVDLKRKVVLIGGDLPGIDKHKTPFSKLGRVNEGTSGSNIMSQIIAQRLDGRRVNMLPFIPEFIAYIFAALSGFLIAASQRAFLQKARIVLGVTIGAFILDAIAFKALSLLLPTAMILFTFSLAVCLPYNWVKIRNLFSSTRQNITEKPS